MLGSHVVQLGYDICECAYELLQAAGAGATAGMLHLLSNMAHNLAAVAAAAG
jgi:hypothetical protein